MTAFWLSLHAGYRCRDSGACCAAGWPIPVEVVRRGAIDAAVREGRLALAGRPEHGKGWLETHAAAPGEMAGTFARTAAGACVFHRGVADGCAVHATLGHTALPATCQHFPRICLIDARGIHVTLSHFCPTAADLLFTHQGPVRIVEGPPPVPSAAVPEGLDVRDSLPPLLSPRVLMDLDAHAAWESYAVDVLAGEGAVGPTVEAAVARLRHDAEILASWTPGRGVPLRDVVAGLAERAAPPRVEGRTGMAARAARVYATCPPDWRWPPAAATVAAADAEYVAPTWAAHQAVVRRYLAATAFASWAAWQGTGPRAMAGLVGLALDVLRVEAARACAATGQALDAALLKTAVREADRLLRHHADRQALADLASRGD